MKKLSSPFFTTDTYRLVIPVFRLVPLLPSAIPDVYVLSCREARLPFLAVLEEFPPPTLFLNPCLVVFLPTYFLVSNIKLLKSNLFSSSSSYLRLRSSSSLTHLSFNWRSLSLFSTSKATNLGPIVFLSCRSVTSVFSDASATSWSGSFFKRSIISASSKSFC